MLPSIGQALPMGITARGDYFYAVRNNQFALQIADLDGAPGAGRPYSASLPVINAPPAWSADRQAHRVSGASGQRQLRTGVAAGCDSPG